MDDTYLYDYALLFVATLYDYFEATGDRATLEELWPVAYDQIHIALARLDEQGLVQDDDTWYCFLDWHDELNKQAGAQAVLIYSMRRGLKIACELKKTEQEAWINVQIQKAVNAALAYLWDEEQEYFISGKERQVSSASRYG